MSETGIYTVDLRSRMLWDGFLALTVHRNPEQAESEQMPSLHLRDTDSFHLARGPGIHAI